MHDHAQPGTARAGPEVGDIVRRFGRELRRSTTLRREELRALSDFGACRTPALGGHLDVCASCGLERPAYNSCRNRHCPKCQSLRQAQWTEARQERVLPTHYFHVVFTLPSELRPLALRYRAEIFDMLFAAASQTLLGLGADRSRLGAQLGITAVLHTWTRDLRWHPHLHCVVTGGGLAADGGSWKSAPKKFLFPVLVMGALFRGKFLGLLADAIDAGRVAITSDDRRRLFDQLYRTRWVVYAKRPFGGPEQVIRYLGRYTHRVGISNARLVSADDASVVFRTKAGKVVELEPIEFLRRLLQHVLPHRFVKIRHYGLHASGNVTTRLTRAREILSCAGAVTHTPPSRNAIELLVALTGIDLRVCRRCGADGIVRRPIGGDPHGAVATNDTS